MEQSKGPVLEVNDLAVSYGRIQAVSGVSLRVERGEIVTLIGANGAGKSTVLKGILGVQRAGRGEVRFRGRDITRAPTDRIVALGVAIVPEGRGIVAEMTVLENLELGAFHRRDRIRTDLERVFDWFPVLAERSLQQAGTLSGGQQQMLALGRAMMARPELILMDEPSLGLAPIVVNTLFEIIAKLNRQGQTILLVEQNARKALQLAHRGYVFDRGRMVLTGSSQELRNNEEVKKAYLGG